MIKRLAAIVGIVLAIAVIWIFFTQPWAVDYVNLGGDPDSGFGLQVITALRADFTPTLLIFMLLPIGAFVLVMQIVFDAFVWEQNHLFMALAALILIISPLYLLYDFLVMPEFDPALNASKWDFVTDTFWISLGLAAVTTIYGLIYAFYDWREITAHRQTAS